MPTRCTALLTVTSLRIIRYCSMADFRFSTWRLSAIFDFSKDENFNCPYPSEGQNASPYQISRRSLLRYCQFSIFQDDGGRHLGFLKIQIFNGWDAQESRTASACLRYGDFSIFHVGGRPPSWIFKSWKFQLPVLFGSRVCPHMQIAQTAAKVWPSFIFSR